MQAALNAFVHDSKVHIALLLIALDFLFGVGAAVKMGVFRLSYIMDFLRNDILFKLLPYFALYWGAIIAGNEDFVIPGFDLGLIAGSIYVGLIAAWVGSILNSLAELRLPTGDQSLGRALAGDERGDGAVADPLAARPVRRPAV